MVVLRPAVPGSSRDPRHLKDALRRWSPTPAFGRSVLLVGLLLLAAMLLGRADLVVLAAPFALGAALGIWRRPSRVPVVGAVLGADFVGEGGRVPAGLSVANPDEVRYDLVILRTAISPWLVVPDGDRPYVTSVAPGMRAELEDRKSTRLNSSHGYISYAVFCLKKKKKTYKTFLFYIKTNQSKS